MIITETLIIDEYDIFDSKEQRELFMQSDEDDKLYFLMKQIQDGPIEDFLDTVYKAIIKEIK